MTEQELLTRLGVTYCQVCDRRNTYSLCIPCHTAYWIARDGEKNLTFETWVKTKRKSLGLK